MTPISPHFSVEELTFSEIAVRRGLDNSATPDQLANLTRLATLILEPLRDLLGVPIHINSGFRSRSVNTLIGGAPDSAHLVGCAADLLPIGLNLSICFAKLQDSDIAFDQLIYECNSWIHISVVRNVSFSPRRMCLLASGSPGAWTYRQA